MTTTVTITAGETPAYVYTAPLNEDLEGEYELTAELKEETRTFHVHKGLDLMVTENKLEE